MIGWFFYEFFERGIYSDNFEESRFEATPWNGSTTLIDNDKGFLKSELG